MRSGLYEISVQEIWNFRTRNLKFIIEIKWESSGFLSLAIFFLFCDRSRKLTPPPQQINLKTKANRVVVIHVFPRFEQLLVFSLSPHWLLEIFLALFWLVDLITLFSVYIKRFDEVKTWALHFVEVIHVFYIHFFKHNRKPGAYQ